MVNALAVILVTLSGISLCARFSSERHQAVRHVRNEFGHVLKNHSIVETNVSDQVCAVGYMVKYVGGMIPKVACPNAKTLIVEGKLQPGKSLQCRKGGSFIRICCSDGKLVTIGCPAVGKDSPAVVPNTEIPREDIPACMKETWHRQNNGPKMQGMMKAISANLFKRVSAKSDDACRMQCCGDGECWGWVRKSDNRNACWLLFLPTVEVGNNTSDDYYMESKPAKFATQKYPYSLPYLMPLDEGSVVRIVDQHRVGGEDYALETFYDRTTVERSKILISEDNVDKFSSYLSISKDGLREELRILSKGGGTLAEELVNQQCGILQALTKAGGKHIATCHASYRDASVDTWVLRVEYVGRQHVSASDIMAEITNPKVIMSLVKQTILAHLEVLQAGYAIKDFSPSQFAFLVLNKGERAIYGLASHEIPIKLVDTGNVVILPSNASSKKIWIDMAASVAGAVLGQTLALLDESGELETCLQSRYEEWQDINDVAVANALKNCSTGRVAPRVNTFRGNGGPSMLVPLIKRQRAYQSDLKATIAETCASALSEALKSDFLSSAETVEPDDERILYARGFATCKSISDVKLECLSESDRVAAALGCTPGPIVQIKGYSLHTAACNVHTRNMDVREPMCDASYPLPKEGSLRWDVSFSRGITKVSGAPTTMNEICCGDKHAHHAAERPRYFEELSFKDDVQQRLEKGEDVVFACSVCGTPLFRLKGHGGRTYAEFFEESSNHGWPSFRANETIWENIASYDFPSQDLSSEGGLRDLDGYNFETHCKTCGAHLGHNLPDGPGGTTMRLCIDVGCIAGQVTLLAKNKQETESSSMEDDKSLGEQAMQIRHNQKIKSNSGEVEVLLERNVAEGHSPGWILPFTCILFFVVGFLNA